MLANWLVLPKDDSAKERSVAAAYRRLPHLKRGLTRDEGRNVALGQLHPPPRIGRQVPNLLRQPQPQIVEVNHL